MAETKKKTTRRKKFRATDFRPESGLSVPGKIAQMLDWAADKSPGTVCTYPQIAKAILDLNKMPRFDSREVEMIRGRMSAASLIMRKEYNRDIVTVPKEGARATFSDEDLLSNCITKKARRLYSAKERLSEAIAILDEEGLVSDDIKYLADWLNDELKPIFRKLESPKATRALLPPPPPSSAPAE